MAHIDRSQPNPSSHPHHSSWPFSWPGPKEMKKFSGPSAAFLASAPHPIATGESGFCAPSTVVVVVVPLHPGVFEFSLRLFA